MKKILLIVNAVLVLAVIGLYILHFCGGSKPAKSNNVDGIIAGEPATEGSIVYIQIDSLVNSYDMFHDLKTAFEVKAKAADETLTKKGKSFEREAMDFQEKWQKGLMTRSQAEETQAKLAQKQQMLQQEMEKIRADLGEEEAVMVRQIYDAVTTFLKEYNKEHNYSLIISTNATTNVIMQGNPNLDITQDVLRGLNESYVKAQK